MYPPALVHVEYFVKRESSLVALEGEPPGEPKTGALQRLGRSLALQKVEQPAQAGFVCKGTASAVNANIQQRLGGSLALQKVEQPAQAGFVYKGTALAVNANSIGSAGASPSRRWNPDRVLRGTGEQVWQERDNYIAKQSVILSETGKVSMTQPPITGVDELEERLSRPTPEVVQLFREVQGDLLVLGVAGKMGPTLARMARRAMDEAGNRAKVIGVARFSQPEVREQLEQVGVQTITCDLLDPDAVQNLPDVPNVVFMAGMKFGTTGAEPLTWAMNTVAPAIVANRFRQSRIVVFSTGNVYPLVPVTSGGATEETPPAPIGEYAQSALGRERVFQYFSARYGTPAAIYRLNYAVELRYGIILDVAQRVWAGEPVPLSMGCVNVIWQGDACAWALRCLALAQSPPLVLNATGPETLSIRYLAERLGELMGKQPRFEGAEAETALLSNASKAHRLFGYPTVAVDTVIQWVAHWVMQGLPVWNKPTHYEVRDGRF